VAKIPQPQNHQNTKREIKKILKIDYANFISAQKLKIEFSLFYPSINLQLPVDISPEFQERIYGTPR
jgi:hypothetical protein